METVKRVGQYCRFYRVHILHMTLKEVEGNDYVNTLWSFEHGRSTNINHLFKYLNKIDTRQNKLLFLDGLITHIGGKRDE